MSVVLGVIVFVLLGISAVIAVGTVLFGSGGYGAIGGHARPPIAPEHESAALRETDVRQMLQARQHRRIARGEPAGDVEAELQELLRGTAAPAPPDPVREADELRADARAIVEVRRRRRIARGEPAGDLEAEIDQLLEELGG